MAKFLNNTMILFSLPMMALFHTRFFLRVISKNRQVYALKILTLAITFACVILVTLFSFNEFGYDQFHQNASHTFRLLTKNTDDDFHGNRLSNRITPEAFKSLKEHSNDDLIVSRLKALNDVTVIVGDERHHDQKVYATDSEITGIFSFDLLQGDVNTFDESKNTLLLSSGLANQYFGNTNVVGRQIGIYSFGDTVQYEVIGVYQDFPQNSHENFQAFISYRALSIKSLQFNPDETGVYGRFENGSPSNYEKAFNEQLPHSSLDYIVQPLPDIYFGPTVVGEDTQHGDEYSIIILVSICVLMLVLALTSYVNLTTLTLPKRTTELAVKKLSGTHEGNLIFMLGLESFVITSVSLGIGIWLLFMLSDWLAPILSIDLASLLSSGDLSLFLLMTVLLFILGLAPLLMARKFTKAPPSQLLSTESITFPKFKRVIIFLQLGISMFLIVASIVIKRQINYSLVKEPGRNNDQVVYLSYPRNLDNEELLNMRLNWKNQNPNILDLIATSQLPNNITSKHVDSDFYFMSVDPSFNDFFHLDMKDGRWFMANDGDSMIVVNEKGREIFEGKGQNMIGIIQDIGGQFNLPEKPVKINTNAYFSYNFLCIRILEVDIRETVAYLEDHFTQNGKKAKISFLNKNFEEWLKYQDSLNMLSQFLTIISVLLSCCAIYGLSLSLIRDKLKQIAIRKTCGASTFNITHLLVKEFTKQMLIAILFFAPVTYIFLRELLRNFVYSTKLNWLDPVFPLAYCALIIIILCSVQALSLNRADLSSALKG